MYGSSDRRETTVEDRQKIVLQNSLSPLINGAFQDHGFHSDDGVRYFRRRNELFHYFIFTLEELSKDRHAVRTDGDHLSFLFGEFIACTPGLLVKSNAPVKTSVVCASTNPMAFLKKEHFRKASNRIIEALAQIDSDRFSAIATEDDYMNFHLRGSPSLEKIYYLTSKGQHREADAWLSLLTHEYRGFRCAKSHSSNKAFDYYLDQPNDDESNFYRLTSQEREHFVSTLSEQNIERNSLGYLYEAV